MLNRTILVFATLALLFANSIESSAQAQTAAVSGIVTEKISGENIIGVPVALYKDTTGKALRGAITNKFGFYSIPKVPKGEYFLVVSGIGYSTYTEKINIDGDLSLNIKLEMHAYLADEVVVTADRMKDPVNRISTIEVKPDFIMKMPSLGGEVDVFRTLQLLPGVKQSNELSSGLYVRGGSPDQNLILLDGVIVYNPSHLGGFLSSFNSDALRDVRLIKGGFPAEYGGRLSSVVDMTMKEGNKGKFSGSGGVSLISSRLTLEGPINENSTFMISGRRMYLDILMWLGGKVTGAYNTNQTPNYYFYDLNAKVNYKLSDNDRLFVSGYFCRDVLDSPKEQRSNFSIFWGNQTANLRWMHIVSPTFFTNTSLIYTNYNFNIGLSDTAAKNSKWGSESKIEDVMLRFEGQYFPNEDHIIKMGSELTYHSFNSGINTNLNIPIPMNSDSKSAIDLSIFAQDEWKITDLLRTNLGLRGYYFSGGNYFNLEPRMSASYTLAENSSLTASVAMAHQFLHMIVRNDIALPTDLWYPSTGNVKPQKSWQTILGYEHIFKEGEYLLSVEAYYKSLSNLLEYKENIDFSLGVPLESHFTTGTGYAFGMEFFLNKRMGNFTGWIGYTLSWTKRQFAELNFGEEFYPRYDRRHDISITLNYELGKRWELGASWVFGTGQGFTMPTGTYSKIDPDNINSPENQFGWIHRENYTFTEKNGYRLPPFHKLDVNFMYKFTWFGLPFQLSLNLYNAYNRSNPFMWFIDSEYEQKPGSTIYTSKKVVKQFTLFPLLPTFGISFKF